MQRPNLSHLLLRSETVLSPEDPPLFSRIVPEAAASLLLVCDHATNVIPRKLGTLGLDQAELERHIGHDIGAAALTRGLAAALGGVAILSGFSRLVIDLNRTLDDPTLMPAISDNTVIPGNCNLGEGAIRGRIDELYVPYHQAITDEIKRLKASCPAPALISIHSFTPMMRGFQRPWHVGILWNKDPRIAVPLMERLRTESGRIVGDNEPYSGRNGHGGTIEAHAYPYGLPHVLIEVRQDLIETTSGITEWSAILTEALRPILSDANLYRPFEPSMDTTLHEESR